MKLNFQEVTGASHTLDIEPSRTFDVVARMLSQKLGSPPESIRLLYKGKVIKNTDKISLLSIKPSDTIIINIVQPKAVLNGQREDGILQTQPISSPVHAKITKTASDPENYIDLVQNLLDMGFEQSKCENALRSTKYNLQEAIDFLFSNQ